jgi:hypothetical protein
MKLELVEWSETQRDAHLWLTDDGRVVLAWGIVGDASHLCALRELEAMLEGRSADILIASGKDRDADVRELWTEAAVDLVVVEEFAGFFGPPLLGARRELLSGLVVEPAPQTWWVSNSRNELTAVAADWSEAVGAMLSIA